MTCEHEKPSGAALTMTVAEIQCLEHCYLPYKIPKLAGDKDEWSALDVLDHPDVPDEDKLWLVLRTRLIPERDLHELACRFAETVAHLRTDPSCQDAVDAKRAWLRGEIDDDALWAARDAAWGAAWGAAWDAAWDAAWGAAWDAAWAANVQIVRELLTVEAAE